MDAQRGVRLLAQIWPDVNRALSEENRPTRLRFISDLLRVFSRNGIDLSDVLEVDEDIRSCAEDLGTLPPKRNMQDGSELDLSGIDEPIGYEFMGGPYDGVVIRLGIDLMEMPPALVILAANDRPARTDGDNYYKLQVVTKRDSNGEPTSEYLAYEYTEPAAK